jgi:Methylamine utilisation protein MauE
VGVRPGLAVFASAALSTVFLTAGVSKLRDLSAFREALSEHRWLPSRFVPSIAVVIPSLELACLALLWTPPTRRVGAALATTLLVAFSVTLVVNLASHSGADCGCFGGRTKEKVSWLSLVRNGVLTGLALIVFFSPTSGPLAMLAATLAGIGAGTLLLLVDQAAATFREDWISADAPLREEL